MVENDAELDEIIEQREVPVPQQVQNVTAPTAFTKKIDETKVAVVEDAAAHDEAFVKKFTDELTKASLELAEVERKKAELEQQNVKYAQELLETQQKLNVHIQNENAWTNKEKRREYHYNGVKPIMEFVGIKTPMNLFILYLLVIVLMVPYLISKLWRGTIGALIAGASDENRSKTAKGFIWTILAVFTLLALLCLVYLFLKWQGLDLLKYIK